MGRWTRSTAVITAIALTIAVFGIAASGALGDRGGGGTSDDSLSQDFKHSTNGAATEFSNAVRELEDKVGIEPGNGTITAAEIGTANCQDLVHQIAAIGDTFDPVTVPSDSSASIDAKLGIWALGVYAQRYDDNPNSIPIAVPISLFFIAAALIFLPAVFTAIAGTLFGPDGVPAVDGIVPFLEPAMQSFVSGGEQKEDRPLVSAADQQGIRDAVASKGLSGDALDLVTRVLTLAASLAIADARR
jgi:hypothetical protein